MLRRRVGSISGPYPVPEAGVLAARVAAVTLQSDDQTCIGDVTACITLMVTVFEYSAGQTAFCTNVL